MQDKIFEIIKDVFEVETKPNVYSLFEESVKQIDEKQWDEKSAEFENEMTVEVIGE